MEENKNKIKLRRSFFVFLRFFRCHFEVYFWIKIWYFEWLVAPLKFPIKINQWKFRKKKPPKLFEYSRLIWISWWEVSKFIWLIFNGKSLIATVTKSQNKLMRFQIRLRKANPTKRDWEWHTLIFHCTK